MLSLFLNKLARVVPVNRSLADDGSWAVNISNPLPAGSVFFSCSLQPLDSSESAKWGREAGATLCELYYPPVGYFASLSDEDWVTGDAVAVDLKIDDTIVIDSATWKVVGAPMLDPFGRGFLVTAVERED